MEDDHNKTIMIRRPPLGESATDASQVSATSKKAEVPPAKKADEKAWFKTPLGIGGLVVAIVAVVLVIRSMAK